MTDTFKVFACGSTVGPDVDILRAPFSFGQSGSTPIYTNVWNPIERYQITNTPIESNKCEDLVGIGHTHFYVALRKDSGTTIEIYEFFINTANTMASLTKWSTFTNMGLKARFLEDSLNTLANHPIRNIYVAGSGTNSFSENLSANPNTMFFIMSNQVAAEIYYNPSFFTFFAATDTTG